MTNKKKKGHYVQLSIVTYKRLVMLREKWGYDKIEKGNDFRETMARVAKETDNFTKPLKS